MLSFLGLVNDLNDAHAKFVERFEESSENNDNDASAVNPIALHDRLRTLQAKMAELRPRIEELQNTREELVEILLSTKSLETIVEKLPEVAEQAGVAERSLEASRVAARGGGSGYANGGREGARRATRIEREARLASAMTASNHSEDDNHKRIITADMYESLPLLMKQSVSLSELESSVSVLLRCGGRLSRDSVPPKVVQTLEHLGVASVEFPSQELCLAREYGVLLL